MAKGIEPDQKTLQAMFTYRDGTLYRNHGQHKGKSFGSENGNGYLRASINDRLHYAHRLIFVLFHGFVPDYVDHIDGNPTNNRIENLRSVTHAQNMQNQKLRRDNKSGQKGVCWNIRDKTWTVQIFKDSKQHCLGTFTDKDAAVAAYKAASKTLHGEFAREAA